MIYDVLHHIVGRSGKFSGIPLHIGHFRAHVDERIKMNNPTARGFFSALKWIVFIQSGMAARLKGLPSSIREPCCSLKYIGGDGTAIGVTLQNLDKVSPVWFPPDGLRPKLKDWGCMDRCVIGTDCSEASASDRDDARTFIRSSTAGSNDSNTFANLREMLDTIKDSMPEPLFNVLELWFSLSPEDKQWSSVRRILRACSYKDSLSGSITAAMITPIRTALMIMCKPNPFREPLDMLTWEKALKGMRYSGLGNDMASACIAVEQDYISRNSSERHTLLALASLLEYLGYFTAPQCFIFKS